MSFVDLVHQAAVEMPSGIPGADIVQQAARDIGKADSVYAPLFVVSLAVIAVLCWLLWRSGGARDALLERVVVVAEGYKTTVTTITGALDGMKGAQTALNQAVHDLAREAEGEAREGRHGQAQIMTVVAHNSDMIRRAAERIDKMADRVGGA